MSIKAAIEQRVAACPDPRMATQHWARWREARGEAGLTERKVELLTALFAQSAFLSNFVIKDVMILAALGDDRFLTVTLDRDLMRAQLDALREGKSVDEFRAALCGWRMRQLVHIGLRDALDMEDAEALSAENADLAEVVTQASLDAVWESCLARHGEPLDDQGAPVSFCVLGMGKLGGRELNFSSDIDLIFIYSAEGETAGRRDGTGRTDVATFMRRVGQQLVEFIGAMEAEGRLYRVDMRLRPEGSVGPLARSLESLEVYFAAQARRWERMAYTKARVIAHRGTASFSELLTKAVRRFAYGEKPGPDLPQSLADLKHRIDREVLRRTTGEAEMEVKRGTGGIREIEFVIGLHQLIHGHRDPQMRDPHLLTTLRLLEEKQHLPSAEARRLRRAYLALRRIEHRLQMMEERQTHTLPSVPEELELVARRLGFKQDKHGTARQHFLRDFNQIASMVHQAFLQHIGAPEATAMESDLKDLLHPATEMEEAKALITRFGFAEPEQAIQVLRSLWRGGTEQYVDAQAQRAFERLLPGLLAWGPQVPSPDLALRQLAMFIDAYKARGVLYALMADQPQLVEVLMRLFGASEQLGSLLIQRPEFFDSVIARGLGLALPEEVFTEAWERLRPRSGDAKRTLDALRTMRQMSMLAIGLRHVLGLDPWPRLARQLSDLAEFVVGQAWHLLVDERGDPVPIVCLGLGKFGGREINIGSDLDVMFVAEPPSDLDELDQLEWMTHVTKRVEQLMRAAKDPTRRGALWSIDARLRPEGQGAPLVCTAERLVKYFGSRAHLWEFQAFLRARPVAGDRGLGQRVVGDVLNVMRGRVGAMDLRGEVRKMRATLERSAKHPGGRGSVDLKRDPGGIIDAEFIVQTLQLEALRDRGEHPAPLTARAVMDLEALDSGTRAAIRSHLLTLRMIECHLRLLTGGQDSQIPVETRRWREIGIAHLGPRTTPDEMRAHVAEVMGALRGIWDEILGSGGA